ncbi:acetyl/propionyl/methylcrotonyl-CoA carboxylase subunit alpha [Desulfopila aestuarii]|uniref:Propionyl-CoA carboxylase alpha chain n=1 Tax=Desulfopila aestuarii DSM 18488 TaxID=1121416 RepID=A0A1M7YEC3_9BACT|nr:acetyl-CoA carboxylase biotin carboxylase subunit [Desulfopila aestuarii]SHO50975.1 propionyl-CoA carboxylase alpha chain [Desulfopila aestuarii DSM 18488]
MFTKILIANRGEIAVRVIRSCRAMGITTVAVYSEPDFRSQHVLLADEAVLVGTARPGESYLVIERIIEAALSTGCEAIHPGYGFLSENPLFAEKVSAAGLVFIGPPPSVISAMGDKIAAKKLAIAANVPTVPGYSEPVVSLDEALAATATVGFPILLKPAAGGGGKGMRIVERKEEMASALQLCQQETRKSFGDERIFVERYITKPRHIEIQLIADQHGNVVHLGERECSIQRRYQKIVEESPSCALSPELREKMGSLACELARTAGYVNAGTVEFILDEDGSFYFLEMNTRLQVEHPVTELVNGLDLVELQLKVAAGEPLPFTQKDITLKGWAIEVRVCAEDARRGFVPSVGLITRYAEPRGQHVRVDSGVEAGSTISVFYDPMLAKVITWGSNREEARKRMVQALNGYHIEGVSTNIDFANQVLTHPVFISGEISTAFIPTYLPAEDGGPPPSRETLHYMALATTLIYHLRETLVQQSLLPLKSTVGVSSPEKRQFSYVAKSDTDIFPILLENNDGKLQWRIEIEDRSYTVLTPPLEYYRRRLKLTINDESSYFRLKYNGNFIEAAHNGVCRNFEIYNPREWEVAQFMPPPATKKRDNILDCPMPGLVVDVRVKAGERVYRGQELIILESMKMESAVSAPNDGVIETVNVQPGDAVETGSALIHFRKS